MTSGDVYAEVIHFLSFGSGLQHWQFAKHIATIGYTYPYLMSWVVVLLKPLGSVAKLTDHKLYYDALCSCVFMFNVLAAFKLSRALSTSARFYFWVLMVSCAPFWKLVYSVHANAVGSALSMLVLSYWLKGRYGPVFLLNGLASVAISPLISLFSIVPILVPLGDAKEPKSANGMRLFEQMILGSIVILLYVWVICLPCYDTI